MRRLVSVLAAGAFLVGTAGTASAELLRWEGTLTLDFVHPSYPPLSLTGGGVATVNGSGSLGNLNSLRLAGGITGTGRVFITDPAVAPLLSLRATVALGTGTLGPISGGGGAPPLTQSVLTLGEMVRLCINFLCGASFVPLPLTVDGTRGAGIGGLITVNGYGTPSISVTGAPWTIGTAVVSTGATANGGPTATALRSGFAHGPTSGTTSTANLGGVVQLVTPIQFTSTMLPPLQRIGLFGELKIVLVPEPSTALLLGAGFAALALVGRDVKGRKTS
jgi:hypothetical protein